MLTIQAIRLVIERSATPRWPFRWLDLESPMVAAAYRAHLRGVYFVWIPVQLALVLLVLLCKNAGFSEASLNLRLALSLLAGAGVFGVVPAVLTSRLTRVLLVQLRVSDASTSLRLKVFAASMIAATVLGFLVAAALVAFAIIVLSVGNTHVV